MQSRAILEKATKCPRGKQDTRRHSSPEDRSAHRVDDRSQVYLQCPGTGDRLEEPGLCSQSIHSRSPLRRTSSLVDNMPHAA
jgi:hypothetical protein